MELDDLKSRWEEQDRKLDSVLRLNARLLNETVVGKARTALEGLSRLLWFEVVMNLLAALVTGSFLASHISEARFLVAGAVLHLTVIALIAVGVRQLVTIKALDYGAPVVEIQRRLEALRVERVRATKWTLLASPFLWTPLQIVALMGLFGVDAYATFGIPYLVSNLLFGLAVLVAGVWISKRYGIRMQGSPLARRLTRVLSGESLERAVEVLRSVERFEEDETPGQTA